MALAHISCDLRWSRTSFNKDGSSFIASTSVSQDGLGCFITNMDLRGLLWHISPMYCDDLGQVPNPMALPL